MDGLGIVGIPFEPLRMLLRRLKAILLAEDLMAQPEVVTPGCGAIRQNHLVCEIVHRIWFTGSTQGQKGVVGGPQVR